MKQHEIEQEERMKKSIDALSHELSTIRAGRANPAVLEKLHVEYYGQETPVNQIAAVSVPEPRILVIQPWEPSVLKVIEKAILASDIGINPTNDGKSIRLVFPALTEERRKDLTKQVHKYCEDGKVSIRNIRRDAVEKYKAMKKKSEITEDDLKDMEKEIQNLTDKYVKEIDLIYAKKEKDLLEV